MTAAEISVPDGMELTECDADPRHSPVLVPVDEDGWPVPCPWCITDDAWKRVLELEDREHARRHRRHRWYARLKLTHWLAGWAYQLGIIAGHGVTWNGHCNGCENHIRFRGNRCYLLGWERWRWRCLRRGHWPGADIGGGMCGTCAPCVACGSTTAGHKPGCADYPGRQP